MLGSRRFRIIGLLAALVAVFSLAAVDMAEARTGGSFGSRGTRTYQSVPATPTSPSITGPVQRSMTQPGMSNPGYSTPSFGRPSLFGGLGGWLLGGLLFSGLFGMMFGGGFGGIGGVFSLLIQLLIVGFVLRWVFRRFGNPQPAAGSYGQQSTYSYQGQQPGGSFGGLGGFGAGPRSEASRRAGSRDEIGITGRDLDVFERRLSQLQDSYSREDYDGLRKIVTPEVMSYLTEELAQSAAQGQRNEVFDVRLLSGDIAEAWREGGADYATVSLRYESRDVMRERSSGRLVSGEDRVVERLETWTFVRHSGGDWLVSAIQT